jgi:valyl-tRNA synthetase
MAWAEASNKMLYEFSFWGEDSRKDWYIELVKSRLQEDSDPTSRQTVQQTSPLCLMEFCGYYIHLCLMLIPEEIWQLLTYGTSGTIVDRHLADSTLS